MKAASQYGSNIAPTNNKTKMNIFLALIIFLTAFALQLTPTEARAAEIANPQQVAAGLHHTVALAPDGTVWTHGDNDHGQLGNGTTTRSDTPIKVNGLNGIVAVAAGLKHTAALAGDGTLWIWGYNGYGQLGDGTTTDSLVPIKMNAITNITAIAAGLHHTVALRGDGTMFTCGYNKYGQLGDGKDKNSYTPVQVALTGVVQVKAGLYHTAALLNDGTVWTWGENAYGQLGNGTTTDNPLPAQISTLTGITAIGTGFTHMLALKNDGTAWGWGDNYYGQLADGTSTGSSTPVQAAITGVTAIGADNYHTQLTTGANTGWKYGYNYDSTLDPSYTIAEKNGTIGQYAVTVDNPPAYVQWQAPHMPIGSNVTVTAGDGGDFTIRIYGKDAEGSDTGFIAATGTYSFTINATGSISVDYGRTGENYRTDIISVPMPPAITATIRSGSGTVTPLGTTLLTSGNSQTYVITPDADNHTDLVDVGGLIITSTTSSITFNNVNSDATLEVAFAPSLYEIVVDQTPNGSITPYTYAQIAPGATFTYEITPDLGYHVETLTVDGEAQKPARTFIFANIHENHTITATYEANPAYTISATTNTGGTITPAGDLQLLGGQNANYTITPDTGYRIDSVLIDGANKGAIPTWTFTNIGANHTIKVAFAKDQYTITATLLKGMGSISPAGTTTVIGGGAQAYTIAPAPGYRLRYLTVNGAAVGNPTDNTYTFTNVRMNYAIGAYFEPTTYTITVQQSANGSISPYTFDGYKPGSTQAYKITASAGYHVDTLTIDGTPQTPSSSYTFSNINENHTIAATYAANPTYTISATAGTGGTITPTGDLQLLGGQGTNYAIAAQSGYRIDRLLVDGVNKGALSSWPFTNVTANHTIAAAFVRDEYTITATVLKGMGSISPAGTTTVAGGASQAYSFTPATGYRLYMVTVNGAAVNLASDGSYTFTNVNGNYTIGATFVPVTYTITVLQAANGSITPYTYNGFKPGTSQTYKVAPNPGYHVETLTVDGIPQTPSNTYTFTDIQADHAIAATFAANPTATITATAGANGSISPSGTETMLSGTNRTYSFAAASGYRTAQVYVDGLSKGTLGSYTFVNITPGNHTIDVTYNPTVTATAGTGGSISPLGTSTVTSGGKITYYINAASGYRTTDVLVDGTSVGAISTYTFSNVTAPHTISATFEAK